MRPVATAELLAARMGKELARRRQPMPAWLQVLSNVEMTTVLELTRFLDVKARVPVASAEMFVGRRGELQQALRVLRSGRSAGVLLQGQGRLGKSSLAARMADRCPEMAVAVVFGGYTALGIVDAVAAG